MSDFSMMRCRAIVVQELYMMKSEIGAVMDVFVFGTMHLVLFGFIANYLSGGSGGHVSTDVLVLGLLLWECTRVTQYMMSLPPLWNVFSRNLSNMFITPLSVAEFVTGMCAGALSVAVVTFGLLALVAKFAFGVDVFDIGWVTLVAVYIELTLFAWAFGLMMTGLVFRFGTRVESLTWGTIFMVEPLVAALYPVKVLPEVLQWISWAIPPTYAFESARFAFTHSGETSWKLLLGGLVANILWFAVGIKLFAWLFYRSRVTGQFARNEA